MGGFHIGDPLIGEYAKRMQIDTSFVKKKGRGKPLPSDSE
jgi:hypothetical protein